MRVRSFCSKRGRKVDNYQATKLIKALYTKRNAKQNKSQIIDNAFKIFANIDGDANNFSINTLLTLLLRFGESHKIKAIWTEICKMSEHREQIKNVYALLIVCFAQSNEAIEMDKFVQILRWMQVNGHSLSKNRIHNGQIAKILSKCSSATVCHLRYLEDLMAANVIDRDEFILCTLIKKYGDLNDIRSALNIFDSLNANKWNKITINLLLTAMLRNGYNAEAIDLYWRVRAKERLTDEVSHCLAIRACANSKNYQMGRRIHFELNLCEGVSIKLRTQLIDFYGLFEDVESAKHIFDSIDEGSRDVVCIGAMLKVFVNNGFFEEVLSLYDCIDSLPNISKDAGIYVLAIKACASLKKIKRAEDIFREIPLFLRRNVNVTTSMIDCYGHCAQIEKAQGLFDWNRAQNEENIVCVNSMMTALMNNARYADALSLYEDAKVPKTETSHVLALSACSKCNEYEKGKKINEQIQSSDNVQIKTSQIDFFGAFGDLKSAQSAFYSIKSDKLGIVSVNAMMTALINNECNGEALRIYDAVKVQKDETTNVLAIRACANCKKIEVAKRIFSASERMQSVPIQTAMIQCFGQCGDIESAQKLFGSIKHQNKSIMTVSAMMSALIKNERNDEALQLFDALSSLQLCHIQKDSVLYGVAIRACSRSHRFDKGQSIHSEIVRNEIKGVETYLVGMYAKFGNVSVCERIFESVDWHNRSVSLWNEMMNAYLANSDIASAHRLFDRMNVCPNYKSFSLLLNGCSMVGDIANAKRIWSKIREKEVKFDCFMIGCLVDCCSRSGRLVEGYEWICEYERAQKKEANRREDFAMWMALLFGCKQRKNALMARFVYRKMNEKGFEDDIDSKHHRLFHN